MQESERRIVCEAFGYLIGSGLFVGAMVFGLGADKLLAVFGG